MRPPKRKLKSRKEATRRSPQQIRKGAKSSSRKSRRSRRERSPQCGRYRHSRRKFFSGWKAKCPPLAGRTISGWLRTKTLLSLPRPIFKIRNIHTCFCRPRPPEQADLAGDLTPINTISHAVGITSTRRGNFCGALLRESRIPRTVAPRMHARLTGDRILPLDAWQIYHQDWQLRSD